MLQRELQKASNHAEKTHTCVLVATDVQQQGVLLLALHGTQTLNTAQLFFYSM